MADLLTVTNAEHKFIQHEHMELGPGIEQMHELAARIGAIAPADLAKELLHFLRWFETALLPHAAWEDHVMYDRVDERAGTPWATRLMRFEHEQIKRVADELAEKAQPLLQGDMSHHEQTELRAQLFAIEALIRAHVEREEVFLFPLLEP